MTSNPALSSAEPSAMPTELPPLRLPLPNALAYGIAVVAFVVAVLQPFAVLDKGLTLAEAVDGSSCRMPSPSRCLAR